MLSPVFNNYSPATISSMSDFDEALKNAESGNVVSQGYVGWCYLYGPGTEVNYSEALRWLSVVAYERALHVLSFTLAICTPKVLE